MSDADLRLAVGAVVAEGGYAKKLPHGLFVERALSLPGRLEVLLGGLAGEFGEGSVEVAHARFAGVLGDGAADGAVGEAQFAVQTVRFELTRDAVALGDLELFI